MRKILEDMKTIIVELIGVIGGRRPRSSVNLEIEYSPQRAPADLVSNFPQ